MLELGVPQGVSHLQSRWRVKIKKLGVHDIHFVGALGKSEPRI